jgi:hypothetical protein
MEANLVVKAPLAFSSYSSSYSCEHTPLPLVVLRTERDSHRAMPRVRGHWTGKRKCCAGVEWIKMAALPWYA